MAYLVVWILFGFACDKIAQSKGLNRTNWALAGVLLGPFGLLFAFLAKPDRHRVEHEAISRGEARRCPHCKELVRPDAAWCKHCHAELT